MFDSVVTPLVMVAMVLVGAALGALAGFVLGRAKGQEQARAIKSDELDRVKADLDSSRHEIVLLTTQSAEYRAQVDGLNQQLSFVKSQLAQAQQTEQARMEHERDRAAAESERRRADREAALAEEGKVELDHVQFGYVPGKTVLHDLSMVARPGKTIAIVGPTGAGKTTIINLLMRFYDVDEGAIRVDGRDIRSYTRASLRGAYAMVLQDTWVFNGTIFENIAYGKQDATMEEVVRAAKSAHIHSFIMRLPEGYNTVISEDGGNISKGQKQLLTIARAMLYNAKMLILDEATSNVDTSTEREVQKAMRELMEGKTCFVIAHRLSTIRNADRILVVDHGDVVEQGDHQTLMAQKGFYYDLYAAQFE